MPAANLIRQMLLRAQHRQMSVLPRPSPPGQSRERGSSAQWKETLSFSGSWAFLLNNNMECGLTSHWLVDYSACPVDISTTGSGKCTEIACSSIHPCSLF
jgi:hypothetical protein